MGGVKGFILFLSGLSGADTVLGHACHILGDLLPPSEMAVVWLNLCSRSLGYHLLVRVDDTGYLLGVLAYSVGECPALDYVVVIKRYFYGGYLLVAYVGGEGQRIFFEKIFGCTATDGLFFADFIVIVDGVD